VLVNPALPLDAHVQGFVVAAIEQRAHALHARQAAYRQWQQQTQELLAEAQRRIDRLGPCR